MILLDGKKIAEEILEGVKAEIKEKNLEPSLGVVLIGEDKPSELYVNLKREKANEVGIDFRLVKLAENSSQKEVMKEIEKLNSDPKIHGIIVQLPLPYHLQKREVMGAIDPKKDADGFHKITVSRFISGQSKIEPVFPAAIFELVKASGQDLENKKAMIITNSKEFGEVMKVFLGKYAVLTDYIFHDACGKNLEKIKQADIIVSACGDPGMISAEMAKDGAVIIDGGITKEDKKVLGDVDGENFENKNVYLSPVPGGVGPVTVACLLRNVVRLAGK